MRARSGRAAPGPLAAAGSAAALVIVLVMVLAASASALIVHVGRNRAISFRPLPASKAPAAGVQPFDLTFHNLDYSGGRVMSSNADYTFYWDPAGAPVYPADYQPALDQFFVDLAHDSGGHQNVDSVATQYNDYSGALANYSASFAGAIVDTDPYPAYGCAEVSPACLTDTQIKTELTLFLKAHALPMDLNHEYFVLLPPGVESCFGASNRYCSAGITPHARESFCAYHGDAEVPGGTIVYADDPYVYGGACDDGNHPNGTTADATISGGLSHEHVESITDPVPNTSWTDWASGATTGYEIGDKCRTFEPETEFGTPLGTAENGAKYNQVINGHHYWFQQEWSNQGHACLQRYTPSGALPTAAYGWSAAGEDVTADGSASTAAGGVSEYEWQLGEFEGQTPTTSCGGCPPGPVCTWGPVIGSRHVALTVFGPDGASAGTAHWVHASGSALPVVTKVSPTKGPSQGGTKVTITGSEFVPGEEAAVTFGGTPATSFTVVSATKITVISPQHAAGTVDVRVQTMFGGSAVVASDRFRFTPTVTGLAPASGPKAGGTHVTVKGSGFAPGATSFKVGAGKASAVTCASSTECTFVTPPVTTAGSLNVVATVSAVSSPKTSADLFTYS